MRLRLLQATLLVCGLPCTALAEPIELRADWLEWRAGRLTAEGDVRLRAGACGLEAMGLTVSSGVAPTILAEHAVLRAGSIELASPRLRWQPGGGLEAQWPQVSLCRCPTARRPLLRLSAERARIAPAGHRVHLRWPSLWVGSRRVLAIPYLALPLHRGVSGLLLPELSWSERDGVRLEQGGYLAGDRGDLLVAAGWVQERGATARLRGTLIVDGLAELELALRGLQDGERWRGALRGAAWVASRGLAAGVLADLVGDPTFAVELERDPDRVFAPYLRSRAFASAGFGPFALSGWLDLYQDLASPARDARALRPGWGSLVAELLPVQLAGPLFLEAALELQRHGAASGERPWRARLAFDPRLALASRVGALRVSGLVGYRALIGWPDAGEGETSARHLWLASAETSLPLGRRFGAGLQHTVEPFAGVLYSSMEPELAGGAFLTLGLRSSLLGRQPLGWRRLARAEVRLEVPPYEPRDTRSGTLLLDAELELALGALGRLRGLWRGRPGSGETVQGRGEACFPGRSRFRLCGGYLRVRELRPDDLLRGATLSWPTLDPESRLDLQASLDQVFGAADLDLGPFGAWARLAGDPVAGLFTQGSYGLRVDLLCRCLRVEVVGISRANQRWPDLLARVLLSPSAPASFSCSSAPSALGR